MENAPREIVVGQGEIVVGQGEIRVGQKGAVTKHTLRFILGPFGQLLVPIDAFLALFG